MAKVPFQNVKSDGKTADIYIYGPIGYHWWDENSWDAASFVSEFNKLAEDHERINIHINSPGGIIDEGLPIFNAIQGCEKDTHTYIDGIAYSMGAVIALAGKTVHAARNSLMLFHNASGWAQGHAEAFRDIAKMLDTYDSSLITSLSSKTGLTEDEVRQKYFDYKDHLLSATEAKTEGFVDVIEDYSAKLPENIAGMTGDQLFALFKNQDSKDPLLVRIMDFFKNQFSPNNNSDTMEILASIGKSLGLAENATIDQVQQAIAALNQKVTDLTASQQAAESASNSLTQAIDAVDDSICNAQGTEAKITALNAFVNYLKSQDATGKTVAPKEKDKIEAPAADLADNYAHNKAADSFLG